MDLSLVQLVVSGVLALFVGILTGIFGVGGGFLMTPALIILVGVSGPIAIGTSLVNFLANSTLGIVKRMGSGTISLVIAALVGIGSMIGVAGGSWLLEALDKLPAVTIAGRAQSLLELVLMSVFLVLLASIALFMSWDLRQLRTASGDPEHQTGWLGRVRLPPYGHFQVLDVPRISIPGLLLLGIIAGVLTGLLGIGGGVVMLPALIYLVGLRTQKATGTSLLLVWIASLTGSISNLIVGNVHLGLLTALLTGGMLGTWLGTHIALWINGTRTRQSFIYVLLLAILLVAGRLVAMFI